LRKLLILFCVIAGVLAVLWTGFVYYYAPRVQDSAFEKWWALHDAGEPMTWEALHEVYYDFPEEQNAAPLYLEAIALLHGDRREAWDAVWSDLGEVPRQEALPPELLARARAVVQENADAFALLDEARSLPGARFPLDFSQLMEMEVPHLPGMRSAARLRRIALEVALADGDHARVQDELRAILDIARVLEGEPHLIGNLVRLAVMHIGYQTLERVLSLGEVAVTPGDVAAIFADFDLKEALRVAMIGERCMAVEMVMYLHPNTGDAVRGLIFNHELLVFMESFETVLGSLDAPWPEVLAAGIRGFGRPYSRRTWLQFRFWEPLSSTLRPALGRAVTAFARTEASVRSAYAAALIEEARNTLGHLPASLEELPPALRAEWPEDPFDGAPLRYALRDPGYVVYSVYVNRSDNGGIPPEEGKRLSNDWVFTVAR